jgi:mono/diheme cytochrome c family protein
VVTRSEGIPGLGTIPVTKGCPMNGRTRRTAIMLCLLLLVASLGSGCSSTIAPNNSRTRGTAGNGGRMMGSANASYGAQSGTANGQTTGKGGTGSTNYSSAGQQIYLTGNGSDGRPILHTAPPVSQGALMMGGGGCGSCHGANGRGGTIRMMMGPAIEAPDITYAALIKAGFTDATIAAAIRKGTDESGKPLKDAMPRWQMTDADVSATIAYLKVLGAQ